MNSESFIPHEKLSHFLLWKSREFPQTTLDGGRLVPNSDVAVLILSLHVMTFDGYFSSILMFSAMS